ncbi:tetratricopeptide repeat protein [Saccharothrix variisporea]|uniref:tetratricopeptide repeat protein n=1 Tax=Saccharothrix variisporea TaxID=543527 RepID=UPI001476C67B|nr:tetratricopeptide repeat protein [Saccharothrix variisporea]
MELRRLREAAKLSLRELAERTHYSVGHISNVEHGTKPMTPDFAIACDSALRTHGRLAELLGDGARKPGRRGAMRPAQLPQVRPLVGREGALRLLDEQFAESMEDPSAGVIAIDGPAGVGKTTLAVAWAHLVKDRFPDGVFFVDLHGHAPEAAPLDPGQVLEDFLRAQGVQPADIPADLERRAARWRTTLDGTKTLVVLDNAASDRQVRPLIPAAECCLVLVTSRRRLSGLAIRDGARRVTVEPLPPTEGLALLRAVVGGARVDNELDAAGEITRFCGGLPLAVRIAAEHVSTHPHLSLEALAAELSSADKLSVLSSHGDETVRGVFSWTYQSLNGDEARLFRTLGLHPGPTWTPEAAAALLNAPVSQVRQLIDRLVAIHFAEEIGPNRYRQHDLLKAYAVERAVIEEVDDERAAANRRVVDWYLHTAYRAARPLSPYQRYPALDPPAAGVPDQPAAFTYDEALTWYETELANLVAAGQRAADVGLHAQAWQLPVVMWNFFHLRKRWSARISTHTVGLAAAKASGDRRGTAWVANNLAMAHRELGQFDLARAQVSLALRLRQEDSDEWGQAWSNLNLGFLEVDLGHADRAAELHSTAVRLFQLAADDYGTACGLAALGDAHRMLGDSAHALTHLDQALELMRRGGDRYGEGYCLAKMGATYQAMGLHDDALRQFDQALEARAEIGDRWGQAEVLVAAGHSHLAVGDTGAASAAWQQALAIFDELDDPRAATVRSQLEALSVPSPRQEVQRSGPSSVHL